jgi:hypothetical protein
LGPECPDAVLDLVPQRTFRSFHQIVLVEIERPLEISLAAAGLRHVEEEARVFAQGIRLLILGDGLIPAAYVIQLGGLLVVLPGPIFAAVTRRGRGWSCRNGCPQQEG